VLGDAGKIICKSITPTPFHKCYFFTAMKTNMPLLKYFLQYCPRTGQCYLIFILHLAI